MINISLVLLPDIGERDLTYLLRIDTVAYDGLSARDLLKAIAQGRCVLWRIEGAAEGILVTSLERDSLWIDAIAGDRLIANAKAIYDEIAHITRRAGRSRIRGAVARRGFEYLYSRMGHKKVATIMEADCGRAV